MHQIPALGLGTFRLKDQQVIDSVRNGLELGYRHIDTAQIYGNEAEVGQAIAASGVPRSELFVTTKIWTDNLGADKLIPSLKESLHKLRTEQVDLTLITGLRQRTKSRWPNTWRPCWRLKLLA